MGGCRRFSVAGGAILLTDYVQKLNLANRNADYTKKRA